jgi:hypothetical protein
VSERRRQLLVELLRLHADPLAFGAALEGFRGSGSALPIRPHERHCRLVTGLGPCTCWLRSDDELGRVLRRQRHERRTLWCAVAERYLLAVRKPTFVVVRRGVPQLRPGQEAIGLVKREDLNRSGDGMTRILVESWRPVDEGDLEAGVEWLVEEFTGPLELPLLDDSRGRRRVWA